MEGKKRMKNKQLVVEEFKHSHYDDIRACRKPPVTMQQQHLIRTLWRLFVANKIAANECRSNAVNWVMPHFVANIKPLKR